MEGAGPAESHGFRKAWVILLGIPRTRRRKWLQVGGIKMGAEAGFCERLAMGHCGLRGGWWTGTLTSYLH